MSSKRKRLIIRTVIILALVLAVGFTIYQIFNKDKTVETGDRAPDFALTDFNGHQVKLSDLKGKAVMLNFWASWCDPCKKEMPYIENVYKTMNKKKVVILAVNIEESHFAIQNFLSKHHITFPIVMDKNRDVTDAYGIGPIPTTFFINKDGMVEEKVVGSMPSEKYIRQKLSKIEP
ncbi:thiol-disulfide oxidoreductase ResA [Scopulibacillus cellulosilyticus]|uniref:Thiol-disulfide oxidoreductase ResA n=1 Tax=Scopulibacillus cellulosilyticus TaxID=2665665 RepID=A0ABW2PTB0_9BACL